MIRNYNNEYLIVHVYISLQNNAMKNNCPISKLFLTIRPGLLCRFLSRVLGLGLRIHYTPWILENPKEKSKGVQIYV